MREIVPSGIASLDKIIGGGFTKGSNILLAGQPGAGKTTLAIQFLYAGATKYNEPGLYASLVEPAESIRQNMLDFKWDLGTLEREKKLLVLDLLSTVGEKSVEANLGAIITAVNSLAAKRLVIDSLTSLLISIESGAETRSFIGIMSRFLKNLGCTTFLVVEIPWRRSEIGRGFEEFELSDAVLVLESTLEDFKVKKRLYVPKMRGVNHSHDCFDFYIRNDGISVSPISASAIK